MASQSTPKDHWTSEAYTGRVAPFVPLLTTRVVALLDPQPTDTILDIGCGDGVLTSYLSAKCAHITGIDASANMIASALTLHSTPTAAYSVLDCRFLAEDIPELLKSHPRGFAKVFSNAALHWIMRDPQTRESVLRGAFAALQEGGVFVAEMGAHGNVGEVHAALMAALVHRGISAEDARRAGPWLFPTGEYMRGLLEGVGFVVDVMETELRQTRLTEKEGGGLEGWVRLFGYAFLQVLPDVDGPGGREAAVREVVDVLEGVGRREEGGFDLGYIRLRFVARKSG